MKMTEHKFKSWDGTELFYRAWLPPQTTNKALLLFHRGHEHSARWQETVAALGLEDVAVFAWDARGHGLSPGERGSAENLGVVIRDTEAFARHVSTQHRIPFENMVVLAHSVGAGSGTAGGGRLLEHADATTAPATPSAAQSPNQRTTPWVESTLMGTTTPARLEKEELYVALRILSGPGRMVHASDRCQRSFHPARRSTPGRSRGRRWRR